jgi:hypothetical protein
VNRLRGQLVPLALGAGLCIASGVAALLSSDPDTAKLLVSDSQFAIPVVGFAVSFLIWRTRPRFVALLVFAAMFFLDNPSENPAEGKWESPLAGLASLWFDNLNKVMGLGALHFALFDLTVVFLVAVVIRRRFRRLDEGVVVLSASGIGLLCAAAFGGVLLLEGWGLAHGGDFRNSLWQVRQLAYVPLLAFIFDGALRGPEDNRFLGLILVTAACFKTLVGWYFYDVVARATNMKPAYVTTHSDSILFVMATVAVIVFWHERRTLGTWLLMGGVSAFAMVGMIINNRRIAYVELVVSLLVIYIMLPWTPLKRALARLTVMMLPLLAVYVAAGLNSSASIFKPVQIGSSLFFSQTDRSTATRDIENFNLDFTLKQNPILGTGFGHEYIELSRADDISHVFPQYRYIPHNSLLGLWAFGGVVGFSLLWMPLVAVVFFAKKSLARARRPLDRAAALTAVAAVVVYCIQAYGDMGLQSVEGTTLLAAALTVVGKLAVAVGAWPSSSAVPAQAPVLAVPGLGRGELA